MAALEGRNAAVIGGTQGLGRATAKALLDRGARVLVTGRDPARAQAARNDLGERAVLHCADMARTKDTDAVVATVRQSFGALDALFVFAAIAEFELVDQVSEASFDRHFEVNARGAFFAMQKLAPCVRDGGSITMTTVTPATATPGMTVYMASKAAVTAFVRGFAAELLPRRVRVNALAPGFIDTPTLGLGNLSAAQRAELSAMGDAVTPMRRHGSVEEIAKAALFLGFDATFCTGIELAVDGGLSTVDAP